MGVSPGDGEVLVGDSSPELIISSTTVEAIVLMIRRTPGVIEEDCRKIKKNDGNSNSRRNLLQAGEGLSH